MLSSWMGQAARYSLVGAFLAQATVSISEFGLPTLAGFVKHDLHLSAAGIGAVVGALTVGKILGGYGAGVAADRLGEWRVMLIGGIVAGASVVAAAFAPLPLLLGLLVVAGAGAAAIMPAGGRAVAAAFPWNRRATALGMRQTAIPAGGLVAAVALPPLAMSLGWRVALAVAGALSLAGAVTAYLVGRRSGVANATVERDGSKDSVVEKARFHQFLRSRQIVLLTIWGCLISGGQYTFVSYIGLQVHEAGGISLATAAILVAFAQLGGIIGRVGWGFVSDRRMGGRRQPLVLGSTAVAATATLLIPVFAGHASLTLMACLSFIVGLSLFGWQGLWVTCMSEAGSDSSAGAVLGFGLTFIAAANALTPPAYGFAADVSGSYRAIWLALGTALVLALIPAALLHDRREHVLTHAPLTATPDV